MDNFVAAKRDQNGNIIGATAISQTWFGKVNQSALDQDALQNAEDGQAVRILVDFL